jgi:hypothetical protein
MHESDIRDLKAHRSACRFIHGLAARYHIATELRRWHIRNDLNAILGEPIQEQEKLLRRSS